MPRITTNTSKKLLWYCLAAILLLTPGSQGTVESEERALISKLEFDLWEEYYASPKLKKEYDLGVAPLLRAAEPQSIGSITPPPSWPNPDGFTWKIDAFDFPCQSLGPLKAEAGIFKTAGEIESDWVTRFKTFEAAWQARTGLTAEFTAPLLLLPPAQAKPRLAAMWRWYPSFFPPLPLDFIDYLGHGNEWASIQASKDDRRQFLTSKESLTIGVTCIASATRAEDIGSLCSLGWWKCGKYVGVTSRPSKFGILLLLPGVRFIHRNMLVKVEGTSTDPWKIEIGVSALTPYSDPKLFSK